MELFDAELAIEIFGWRNGRPSGTVLVLFSALPLLALLFTLSSRVFIGIAIIAGGLVLIHLGVDEFAASVLVISASALVVALDAILMRKRLVQVERCLASTTTALRALEVTEERRRAYFARQPFLGPTVDSHDGNHSDLGLAPEGGTALSVHDAASTVRSC